MLTLHQIVEAKPKSKFVAREPPFFKTTNNSASCGAIILCISLRKYIFILKFKTKIKLVLGLADSGPSDQAARWRCGFSLRSDFGLARRWHDPKFPSSARHTNGSPQPDEGVGS